MFIIFDLDDTLIDTTGSLSLRKMEEALAKMVEGGLRLPDSQAALLQLSSLDEGAASGRDALSEFAEIHDISQELLDLGLSALRSPSSDLPIFPQDGAIELLDELAGRHHLALVTIGEKAWQLEKLEKAGIDSSYFPNILR